MFLVRLRNGRCDGKGKRKGGNFPEKEIQFQPSCDFSTVWYFSSTVLVCSDMLAI